MALVRKWLTLNGKTRSYLINKVDHPKGLIVALHGLLDVAKRFADRVLLHNQTDFTVVYPDNAQGGFLLLPDTVGWSTVPGSDDEAFIDTIVTSCGIFPVFVTGLSAGGCLAYRLATDKVYVEALAPVAGREYDLTYNPTEYSALWHIHGAADNFSPFDGNERVPSAEPGFKKWVDAGYKPFLTLVPDMGHEWNHDGFDTTAKVLEFFRSR